MYQSKPPAVWGKPKSANLGAWPDDPNEFLFVRVTWATLPVLYGVAQLVLDESFWTGTEEEIEQTLNTLREQFSEVPMTKEEVCGNHGAAFQLDQQSRNLEVQQGPDIGLPPPWELRQTEGVLQYRTKEVT